MGGGGEKEKLVLSVNHSSFIGKVMVVCSGYSHMVVQRGMGAHGPHSSSSWYCILYDIYQRSSMDAVFYEFIYNDTRMIRI